MATMEAMVRPGRRARRQLDVIQTMKALTLHAPGIGRRAWVSADRIASAMDVDVRQLAGPLANAEAEGLIELRRTELGRLTAKLTRISAPKVRRHIPVALNDELHDCPQADLVRLVASMPGTAPLVEDLAENLDVWPEDVCRRIVEAEAGDWLAGWPDGPEGPAVCLTPLSTQRLGLAISADMTQWIRLGAPDPSDDDDPSREFTEGRREQGDAPSLFSYLEDPSGSPEQRAIDAEAAEARAAELAEVELPDVIALADHRPSKPKKRGAWSEATVMSVLDSECLDFDPELRIPRPVKFLGFGRSWPVMVEGSNPLRPWTGPKDGPCPCCGGLPLGYRTVCLNCHNCGVQLLLDRIKSPAPAPDRKPASVDSVHTPGRLALAGGL